MPDTYTPLTPQSQWETTGFNFPNPGSVIRATPIRNLFQKLLNRTEYLKDLLKEARGGDLNWSDPLPSNIRDLDSRLSALETGSGGTTLAAHRSNTVLDHPDSSVTESKLANDAVTTVKIKDGAVTNAKISVTTTLIPNLNADLLDGYHASDFPRKAEDATITGSWTFSSSQTFNSSITVNSTITATGTITAPTLQGNNSSTLLLNARSQSLEARIAESGTGTRYFSVTSGSSGGTTLFQVGSDSKTRVRSTLIIDKVSGVARIEFPNETGGNDPGFIEHRETTADQAELRISISDNDDSSSDYLVIGASPSGNFTGRLRIDTRGRLIFGDGTNWDAQIYRSAADTLTIDKHLSITNNLSVGGTTTLSGSLTSSGTATFANTLRISGTGAELIVGSDTPSNPNLRFLGNYSDGKAYIQAGKSNTDTQADLVISRYATTNSTIRSLQIYSDASSFSGTLSVGGNTSISGDLTLTDVKKRIYSTVPIYEIRASSGSGQWILLGTFDIPNNFNGVRLDGKVYRAGAEAPISGSQIFVHIGREGNGSYTVRLGLYPTAIVSNEVSVYRFGILNDLAVVQTGQNTFSLYGKLIMDIGYTLHASWNIAHNLSNYTLSQGDISRTSSLPSPVTGGLSVVWSTDTNARRYLISDEHIEDNTISVSKLKNDQGFSTSGIWSFTNGIQTNSLSTIGNNNLDISSIASINLRLDTDLTGSDHLRVYRGPSNNQTEIFRLSASGDSIDFGGSGTIYRNTSGNLFSSTDKVFQIRSANQAVVSLVSDLNSNGARLGGIYFGRTGGQADNHVNTAGITAIQRSTGSLAGTDLSFWVKGTAAPVEFLRAMVNGSSDVRVGINTSSPQDCLHVEGNILSSGYYGAPIGSVVRVGNNTSSLVLGRITPSSGNGSLTDKWFRLASVTLSGTYLGFHLELRVQRAEDDARASDILIRLGHDSTGSPNVDRRLHLSTPSWSSVFLKDIAIIQTGSNVYEIWLQMGYSYAGSVLYTGLTYHQVNVSNITFTQGATDFVDTSSLPSPISDGLNIKWSDNTSANTRLIGYASLPDIGNRGRDILVARRVIYASNPSQSLLEIYKSDGWFTIPGRLIRAGLGSYGEQSVRSGATRVYRLEIGYTGNSRSIYDPSNTYWNNGYTTGAYWIRILKDSDSSEIFSQGISNFWSSRSYIGYIRSIEIPSTSTLENAGSLRFQMGIFWDNNSPSWPTSNISGDNVTDNYLKYGKDTYLSVFSLVWEVYDRLP